MGHELVATIIAERQAEAVSIEARTELAQFRRAWPNRHGRDERAQLARRRRLNQRGAVGELSLGKLYEQPLRPVLGIRVDAAGGIRVVAVERSDRADPAVDRRARRRDIASLRRAGLAQAAPQHAARRAASR